MLTVCYILIVFQVLQFTSCNSNKPSDSCSHNGQYQSGDITERDIMASINTTVSEETEDDLNDIVWDKQPIPNANAFHSFDQAAVKILTEFIGASKHTKRLSQPHLQLIKKYLYEWFLDIQEPTSDSHENFDEELGIFRDHIPKAMGFQDVVVKNIIRVQVDLQRIKDYSDDLKWKELVVDKISEAEAVVGLDILRLGEVDVASSSLALLSSTYNLHPFELYPKMFSKDSSIPSFVHAAIHSSHRNLMSISLEWLEATKSLLNDDLDKVWKNIYSENENLPKSKQMQIKYWLKVRNLREAYEKQREGFVKKEIAKLENIFHALNITGSNEAHCCNNEKLFKDIYAHLYLNIISNVSSIRHDLRFHDQDPNHYYGFFPRRVTEERVSTQSSKESKENFATYFSTQDKDDDLKIKQDKLCRGAYPMKRMSRYFCSFDHRNSPYLLLMPVKVEILNSDPEVMIFHSILGDDKISSFQQMALPFAAVSKTQGSTLADKLTENIMFRKSYVAWLHELVSKKISDFNHLVSHITGYDATNKDGASESLQVNSYISGGFYVPHQDAFDVFTIFDKAENKETLEELLEMHSDGDRIATFMIYLNDDLIGGRTVFPHLGISAAPEKGSAIFWRNTYLNGTIHPDALHAGCQVLAGTKWVANKWIRSNSQMFRRPCALEKNA